jgi:hypothetical protein
MGIFDELNFSMPGARNVRPSGVRAKAEDYAASLGLQRGGPGWGDAIRDFVMNGPPTMQEGLPGEGYEAGLQRQSPRVRARRVRAIPPPPRRQNGPVDREPTFEEEWQTILALERGLNPDGTFRTSPDGAVGPAQMLPSTGPEAATLAGRRWDPSLFRTDREYNEALGRAYYADLRGRYDAPTAAAAYNSGPTRIRNLVEAEARTGSLGEWENHIPDETHDYLVNFRARLGLPDSPAQRAYEAARARRQQIRQRASRRR